MMSDHSSDAVSWVPFAVSTVGQPSVLTMTVGNVMAIIQQNTKRLLAYSSVAHAGYLLVGVAAGTRTGYSAVLFYLLVYTLMTIGAFTVVAILARRGEERDRVADLAGLGAHAPLLAAVMAICMFSLAGVPPLVGFYAKLAVLQALLASPDAFHVGLAVFAVIMSLVGAFYYLRLVKLMYFDAPTQTAPIEAGADVRSVLSVNGALVLVLGIGPGGLMALCAQAVASLFAS